MIFSIKKVHEAQEILSIYYYRIIVHRYNRMLYMVYRKTRNLELRLKTAGLVNHDRILTGRDTHDSKVEPSYRRKPGEHIKR